MAVTILGQKISLIRPSRISRPIVAKRGSAVRASRPKVIELTPAQKLEIAHSMGFQLATEGCMKEGR
jgi:hypothetical protein